MNKKKLYNVLAWLALGSILTFSVVEYIITGALSQKTLRISSSISGALGLGGFLYYLLRYLKEGIDFYDTKNQTKEDEIIISDKDKEEILQKLRNDLVNETTEGIIWSLYNEAEERLSEFTEVTVAGNLLNETRDRLKNEIQYLKIRSNINLFLGIVITVFGFSLLWYYLTGVKNITQDNFLIAFFPRFTLIVFIELFAYFFLRLYKESLNEVKFFQNELTNIEVKLSAVKLTFSEKDKEERMCVINSLAQTERNNLQAITKSNDNVYEKVIVLEVIKSLCSQQAKSKNKS